MEAGRLGAVLLQYPWSFKNSPESSEKLLELFRSFDGYPLALEVRHGTFQNEEFFRFLNEQNVAWVNLDQPLFHDSVKPAEIVTGPLAYVRLHGRNYEKWFAHNESWERYNYLYSPEELAEPLTPRELEVLQLLSQGLPNKRIAQRLAISEHTVKFHVNAILGKLSVQSRSEAIVHAVRMGLVVL